jgi:hypothetical protein
MSLRPANAMEKEQAKTSSVRKERGHSNGHQQQRPPKGPTSEHLSTLRGSQAPEQGKHCARGGTRTGLQPLQTLASRGNIRNPARSDPCTTRSEAECVDSVHTPFLPFYSNDRGVRHTHDAARPMRTPIRARGSRQQTLSRAKVSVCFQDRHRCNHLLSCISWRDRQKPT